MNGAALGSPVGVLVGLVLIVGLVVFLMVLRPGWTWAGILAGAVLVGDRLDLTLWAVAVAVAGVWLLVTGARVVWRR